MGLRSEWVAAKAPAKRLNNNTEVKFAAKSDLGPALDKLEAAEKEYEKHAGDYDAAWAKAMDAWVAAGAAAHKIAVQYQQGLPAIVANDVAKQKLDTFLVFTVYPKTTKIVSEGKRLETRLVKARKQKQA